MYVYGPRFVYETIGEGSEHGWNPALAYVTQVLEQLQVYGSRFPLLIETMIEMSETSPWTSMTLRQIRS
jgi:hypothetical protein